MPVGGARAGILGSGIAIPDSVIQQFDATQESTGVLSTLTDQFGFANLSGHCEVILSGINGKQTYRFATSETATHSTTIATSDPFAVVFVVQQQDAVDSNGFYFDGGSQFEFGLQDNGGGDSATWRGGNNANGLTNVDQNVHIYSVEGLNGSDVDVRQDGVDFASTSLGSSNFTGLSLAGDANNEFNVAIDIGQIEVLKNHTQTELESVESRLADKWGVTLG